MDKETKQATKHAAATTTGGEADITIGIRPAMEDDLNYVRSAWLDNFYRDGNWGKRIDPELYRRCHRHIIETLIKEHTVLIAFDPADPRVIMGFVCGDDYPSAPVVHYIYVPTKLHGWGIATQLMIHLGWSEGRPIIGSHYTRTCREIEEKHFIVHNPYLMFDNHRSILSGQTTPRQSGSIVNYRYTSRGFVSRKSSTADSSRRRRYTPSDGADRHGSWGDSDGGPGEAEPDDE